MEERKDVLGENFEKETKEETGGGQYNRIKTEKAAKEELKHWREIYYEEIQDERGD